MTTADPEAVLRAAEAEGIFVARIGTTGGSAVAGGGFSVALADLREASDSFFRDWMEG